MKRKVSVIGAGGWGCALACVLCDNGHDVALWSALPEEVRLLDENRENKAKLPGVRLADSILITDDLPSACKDRDLLVFAVPSVFIRSTAKSASPWVREGQMIVSVAKGIEENTLNTMTDIIKEEIPWRMWLCCPAPPTRRKLGGGCPPQLWPAPALTQPPVLSRIFL